MKSSNDSRPTLISKPILKVVNAFLMEPDVLMKYVKWVHEKKQKED
jgi:hypothetical protein